ALDLTPRERTLLYEARRVSRSAAIHETAPRTASSVSGSQPTTRLRRETASNSGQEGSSERLPIAAQSRTGPSLRIIPHASSRALPLKPAPLIGREYELKLGRDTLLRRDVRLVMLTGVGGTGKTRLALEVAEAASASFRDGAYFV